MGWGGGQRGWGQGEVMMGCHPCPGATHGTRSPPCVSPEPRPGGTRGRQCPHGGVLPGLPSAAVPRNGATGTRCGAGDGESPQPLGLWDGLGSTHSFRGVGGWWTLPSIGSPNPTDPHAWTLPSHWGPPTLQTPMHGHCHPTGVPLFLQTPMHGYCHPIGVPRSYRPPCMDPAIPLGSPNPTDPHAWTLPSHCDPFGPIDCCVWTLPSHCGPCGPTDTAIPLRSLWSY